MGGGDCTEGLSFRGNFSEKARLTETTSRAPMAALLATCVDSKSTEKGSAVVDFCRECLGSHVALGDIQLGSAKLRRSSKRGLDLITTGGGGNKTIKALKLTSASKLVVELAQTKEGAAGDDESGPADAVLGWYFCAKLRGWIETSGRDVLQEGMRGESRAQGEREGGAHSEDAGEESESGTSVAAAAAAASSSTARTASGEDGDTYPLADLQTHAESGTLGADLDMEHLEVYLSEADFEQVFEMNMAEFRDLPEWKQGVLRKKQKLVTPAQQWRPTTW